MSQTTLIPSLPDSLEDSPLARLWQHALMIQSMDPAGEASKSDKPAPKTYVAPNYGEVINWVPQDCPHPLYYSENTQLLKEILLDYIVQEEIKPDDPRMSQPNGLQVTNLSGKTLTFTRDASGIKVEEVPVTDSKTNADGTISYILENSIFGHWQKVQDARKALPRKAFKYGAFGERLWDDPPSPV